MFVLINAPIEVANIAIKINIKEKPIQNIMAFIIVFLMLSFSLPEKYEIYKGTNGKMHGDIKLAKPSRKVIK